MARPQQAPCQTWQSRRIQLRTQPSAETGSPKSTPRSSWLAREALAANCSRTWRSWASDTLKSSTWTPSRLRLVNGGYMHKAIYLLCMESSLDFSDVIDIDT
ncbi:hypothetical protein AAC387_Pa06g0988 [Persea americana]